MRTSAPSTKSVRPRPIRQRLRTSRWSDRGRDATRSAGARPVEIGALLDIAVPLADALDVTHAVEIDRQHPAAWIGRTRLLSVDGRHDEAVTSAREMLATVGRDSLTLGAAAFALIRAGRREEADVLITELNDPSQQHTVSPMVLADIAVAMGDSDSACEWLEKAVDDKALGLEPGDRTDLRTTAAQSSLPRSSRGLVFRSLPNSRQPSESV